MAENLLFGLASIIILGITAEWLAWRLHLPSILLLLIFGLVVGPLTGLLDPDALFGAALLALVLWLRGRDIKVTWYEWLIGVIGLALLLFTIQNLVGSFAELEPTAAYMFLLVTGLPALILLAIAWQLVARRQRAG